MPSPCSLGRKLPKIRCDFLEPRTLVGSESRTPGIRHRFFFNMTLDLGVPPMIWIRTHNFLGKLSSLPRPVPAASRIGLVGPAWTRGEMERPAGTQDMGSYKTLVPRPGGDDSWGESFRADGMRYPNFRHQRNRVCLKMGYTSNYSHLVGIMIINHWVYGYTIFRQTRYGSESKPNTPWAVEIPHSSYIWLP